jgi:MoaA/NifB/PqqE/SkfB family radical SAM enzyme
MLQTVEKSIQYIKPLNNALNVFFKDALRISLKDPGQALYFFQTVKNQQKASHTRAKWQKLGIHVPPMMIISITNRCNLHCRGCYHQALRDVTRDEMSREKLRGTIAEASELGVSFIILAGGEPLVRPDILDVTRDFPNIIFLLFTNGLLIDEAMAARFKAQKNIVPLISLEGFEQETNLRRGSGVYERLAKIIEKLNQERIFFGTSITVTSANFSTVIGEEYISYLAGLGCKMFFFVEYSPIQPGTQDLMISDLQRTRLAYLTKEYHDRYAALFISVPGDEKDFGGCLAAGRGFIHISAEGDVEPCPFAPYSDVNLKDKSLFEALQSPLLKAIRESDQQPETSGGCALFAKKEWVEGLLASQGHSLRPSFRSHVTQGDPWVVDQLPKART